MRLSWREVSNDGADGRRDGGRGGWRGTKVGVGVKRGRVMPFHIPRWGLAVTSSQPVPDLAWTVKASAASWILWMLPYAVMDQILPLALIRHTRSNAFNAKSPVWDLVYAIWLQQNNVLIYIYWHRLYCWYPNTSWHSCSTRAKYNLRPAQILWNKTKLNDMDQIQSGLSPVSKVLHLSLM